MGNSFVGVYNFTVCADGTACRIVNGNAVCALHCFGNDSFGSGNQQTTALSSEITEAAAPTPVTTSADEENCECIDEISSLSDGASDTALATPAEPSVGPPVFTLAPAFDSGCIAPSPVIAEETTCDVSTAPLICSGIQIAQCACRRAAHIF